MFMEMTLLDKIAYELNADITEWNWFDLLDWGVYKSNKYHIGIKKWLSSYHKRFVIAHELAHIKDDTVWVLHNKICENRADKIAGEILIPKEKLKEAIDWYWEDCDFLHCLFGTNQEVIEKRYKDLLTNV